MKMAIVGSGPLAILSANYFDQMGAEVVLFQRSPLGGNLNFLNEFFPSFKMSYNNEILSVEEFFNTILKPAVMQIEARGLTKKGDVLRVHKRFLHQHERIPQHSRLHDLFRVVYSLNPKDNILKQFAESPEMFKQLGDEVIQSLHLPVESFEDFDLVIEARGLGKAPVPMGAGGSLALNENNLKESTLIYYEKDIFTKLDLTSKKNLILIGEGISLKLALLKLKDWLFSNTEHRLQWVTYQTTDSSEQISWLDAEVKLFLKEVDERFDKAKQQFEEKVREWRDLDDFVKAKIARPLLPSSPLTIYAGYDVTSVDRLLDREEIFATIELPDFRKSLEKESKSEMLTLAGDAICVARGVDSKATIGDGLEEKEPGFYTLNSLEDIATIELDILNYFKKV